MLFRSYVVIIRWNASDSESDVRTISFTGFVRTSDSLSEAFQRMITTYDPFSTANTVLILVLVLPAFGANALADRLYKGPRR